MSEKGKEGKEKEHKKKEAKEHACETKEIKEAKQTEETHETETKENKETKRTKHSEEKEEKETKEEKEKKKSKETNKKINERIEEEKSHKEEDIQAEVNIGLIGHVDSGKCIALDECILLNNHLTDGIELCNKTEKEGRREYLNAKEALYSLKDLKAYSFDGQKIISAKAKVFLQDYKGKMIDIETKTGRRIKITPEHPLLSNDGKKFVWIKAKELLEGNYIACTKQLKENSDLTEWDWITELKKSCYVINAEDYKNMKKRTNNFKDFYHLNENDYNILRILAKKSFRQLEKNTVYGSTKGIKTLTLTDNAKKELNEFFKKQKFEEINEKQILVNYKKNTCSFHKINDFGIEKDTIKWFSFVLAEGTSTRNKIHVAQNNGKLLNEFLRISKEKFGVSFKRTGEIDYYYNNIAFIEFLKARLKYVIGNARIGGIPYWIYSLDKEKACTFLAWFFSLEGYFNLKMPQITLIQANKRNITVLSYLLQRFAIKHQLKKKQKYASNTVTKKKQQYWEMRISGNGNTRKFIKTIGIVDPKKEAKISSLPKVNQFNKQSDAMIPLSYKKFSELVKLLGYKKKHFGVIEETTLKKQPWFWAYQDCRTKNAISEKNLKNSLACFNKRITFLKKMETKIIDGDAKNIRKNMKQLAVSINEVSWYTKELSHKKIYNALNKKNKKYAERLNTIKRTLKMLIQTRITQAETILGEIENTFNPFLEFDKIKKICIEDYDGKVIDLHVPEYHNFIAGFGGIISHNTSLVQALTGKWTDTHSEELKRGISIRLGYADAAVYCCQKCKGTEAYSLHETCEHCNSKGNFLRKVSFVDAPGHETLMTTMLSGAALMHGAILVVAANEHCPQAQTIEHLIALQIAGIEKIVVAQNKIDLVDEKQAKENYKEIKEFLKETRYKDAVIVPTAAHFKTNIDLLIEALEKEIPTPKFDLKKSLRMYCARSFDINKPGTLSKDLKGGVIGGTILQGKIAVGDNIEITPGINEPIITTVKGISIGSALAQEAVPGGLIAIETLLDPSITANDQMRGQVIGRVGELPKPVKNLSLEISFIERIVEKTMQNFNRNEQLVLTIGTMTSIATVTEFKKNNLQIVLKEPAIAEAGQKIAINKREEMKWRLTAYGVIQ